MGTSSSSSSEFCVRIWSGCIRQHGVVGSSVVQLVHAKVPTRNSCPKDDDIFSIVSLLGQLFRDTTSTSVSFPLSSLLRACCCWLISCLVTFLDCGRTLRTCSDSSSFF